LTFHVKKEKVHKKKFNFALLDNTDSIVPCGNITYIIAFVIPVFIFAALYYIRDIFPFGTSCYLRSDMYHQYAPFFSEFWYKLRHGESLLYSWDIGMGTNFTSLFAYYLASPANWIIVLFPQKYMIEIMNGMIILKLAASSVTFTYYIVHHFKTKNCTVALFGVFYALSGFVAAYSWNIMWLDCVILLPLIMLGLERLVNENKCILYCICLGLCIYTNYYISIMVCLSVILYFVVLMISYNGLKHPRIYFKKFVNWCVYSLLAGGLAACLLLPEMYTFSLSASSDVSFPKTLSIYFSILEMLTRQLINVPVHLGLDHFPNIYCGVFVFLMIPLYAMNRQISQRERIGKFVMILAFLLAFNFNILNFIWHGFHYPNSLPCRQSFIYIFFILTMCYEAFYHINALSERQLSAGVWISLGLLVVIEQYLVTSGDYDQKLVYISGAFILLYALLLYLYRKSFHIPVLLFAVYAIGIIECTINMESTGLGTTSRTSYLLDYDAVETVLDTVSDNDDSFYRVDKVTGIRSKNDGAWHNYRSLATFSSTSNAGMSDLFGLLGIESSTNAYGCEGSTMVTNSLFSVKYIISNQILEQSLLQSYFTGYDGEFIYQNQYTLSPGFLLPSDFDDTWQPSSICNGIENQNSLIKAATGINSVFTLTKEFTTETDVFVEPVKNGHMYLCVSNPNLDTLNVNINGTLSTYSGLKNGNHTIDIGYVTTNDSIEVYADVALSMSVYTLEEDRFISAYKSLSSSSLNVTSFSDTKISGTVNAASDGTFVFSIPYDKGWHVYVDGKRVETTALKDALLSINISSGEHTIKLKYMPVNLIKGCIITLLCIIILVMVCLADRRISDGRIDISSLPVILQEYILKDDIVLKRRTVIIDTKASINEDSYDYDLSETVNDYKTDFDAPDKEEL
jgi:uncharacterized membrane protein YfhO